MMSTSWAINNTAAPEPQAEPETRGFPEGQAERLIAWIESGAITLMLTSLFLTSYG